MQQSIIGLSTRSILEAQVGCYGLGFVKFCFSLKHYFSRSCVERFLKFIRRFAGLNLIISGKES
jgi:hypothetical protein